MISKPYMNCTIRARFLTDPNDPRPAKFPPPGPWWHTGYRDAHSIVVAWFPKEQWEEALRTYWPDASSVDAEEIPEGPQFTDRFQKPGWCKEETA